VREWQPDEVVLLPLYPQFSTTTTGSSLSAWRKEAARIGLAAQTTTVCCYPTEAAFVASTVALIAAAWEQARAALAPEIRLRLLFSAHGLPEVIVRQGDPYKWQVEQTVAAVLAQFHRPDLEWAVCYQSRATPQSWIGPSTEQEVERAARDKTAVLVVPIAFVSDHSETLVELDVEYRELADSLGVPGYFRVPAQNANALFIGALAGIVRTARSVGPGLVTLTGPGNCPPDRRDCPQCCPRMAA